MKLQAETFGWITRMPPILEDHVTIIESSRKEAEEGLKVGHFYCSVMLRSFLVLIILAIIYYVPFCVIFIVFWCK